jgi:hypothetical protein
MHVSASAPPSAGSPQPLPPLRKASRPSAPTPRATTNAPPPSPPLPPSLPPPPTHPPAPPPQPPPYFRQEVPGAGHRLHPVRPQLIGGAAGRAGAPLPARVPGGVVRALRHHHLERHRHEVGGGQDEGGRSTRTAACGGDACCLPQVPPPPWPRRALLVCVAEARWRGARRGQRAAAAHQPLPGRRPSPAAEASRRRSWASARTPTTSSRACWTTRPC